MSEIRDRVKDKLFSYLADCRMELDDRGNEGQQVERIDSYVELILSIKQLAIVDREAELPSILVDPKFSRVEIIRQFKEMVLEAGWIKEVKDDIC